MGSWILNINNSDFLTYTQERLFTRYKNNSTTGNDPLCFGGTQNHVFSISEGYFSVAVGGNYTSLCMKEFFGSILSIIFKNGNNSGAIITSTAH